MCFPDGSSATISGAGAGETALHQINNGGHPRRDWPYRWERIFQIEVIGIGEFRYRSAHPPGFGILREGIEPLLRMLGIITIFVFVIWILVIGICLEIRYLDLGFHRPLTTDTDTLLYVMKKHQNTNL